MASTRAGFLQVRSPTAVPGLDSRPCRKNCSGCSARVARTLCPSFGLSAKPCVTSCPARLFPGWLRGLEPPTPRSTIWYSNQLSYSHRQAIKPIRKPVVGKPQRTGLAQFVTLDLNNGQSGVWEAPHESLQPPEPPVPPGRTVSGSLGPHQWVMILGGLIVVGLICCRGFGSRSNY